MSCIHKKYLIINQCNILLKTHYMQNMKNVILALLILTPLDLMSSQLSILEMGMILRQLSLNLKAN